jgi:alpha-N-arabinofuranosidase
MRCLIFISLIVFAAASAFAANTVLVVDTDQSIARFSPIEYGLMTEEINHSYDGGLYAELIQNRALLDNPEQPAHWSAVKASGANATISLDHSVPFNDVLTNSLRLDVSSSSRAQWSGAANDGFWGIPVKPRTKYRASFYARATTNFSGPLKISIESDDGKTVFAEGKISHIKFGWNQYKLTLKTGAKIEPTARAKFVLSVNQPGSVWFTLVSLFPPTYHDRPNGNRIDIMEKLADMKPSFLRFPGGNFVEGDTLATRYDWKKTIGPLERRPGHPSCWGYRSSDGLGLIEFLEWCEDLKMEPVLAVYAGYNLNHTHIEPGPALQPFVQDALDEIEYAADGVSTKWGAARARDGHPAPFKLRYVEIGNEDWFDNSGSYDARFAQFFDAIKSKYPNLQCISTVGNEHPAEQRVHSRKPDLLDEHYYSSAREFDKVSPTKWDNYDASGPRIFVGEWAAYEKYVPWESPAWKLPPTPSLRSALADAAWMCGMERHSDLTVMQCYSALFVNVNPGARQWRPDLIGYDALSVYGSPSYHAIAMFSQNHGDRILKTEVENPPLHYSATKDSKTGAIYLKLVNTKSTLAPVEINLRGQTAIKWKATALTLSAPGEDDSNSIEDPNQIVPMTTTVPIIKPDFTYTLPPCSVVVLRINAK